MIDDDNDESDDEMTESDRDEILDPKNTNEEHSEEEEEYDDEFNIEEEENIDDEETMYDDEEDEVTKELYEDVNVNLGNEDTEMTNADQANNEIASLMETSARHATTVPKNRSGFTTTIPPPPPFFNPLLQQATPTSTPTTSEATTLFPSLLDFVYVFKFNERVLNLEKDILPQAVSDFENPVIEKSVIESVEALVFTRYSSQPTSTYKVAASLSEFKLTKILIEKMEKNKSYDKANYKKKLYDALVESYNTDKDLFDSYGEVFSLKGVETTVTKIETPPLDQIEGRKEGNRVKMLSPLEIKGQRNFT
ncbi:hypothetical protein Tco_0711825 [Tanacetum coccineum]